MLIIAAVVNLLVLHLLSKKFENRSFYKALITIVIGLVVGILWYSFTSLDSFYLREILWSIAIILSVKFLYDLDWKSSLKTWMILFIIRVVVETIVSLVLIGVI
jgi:hypothetical protein